MQRAWMHVRIFHVVDRVWWPRYFSPASHCAVIWVIQITINAPTHSEHRALEASHGRPAYFPAAVIHI
jgi:hypothetical protein